MIRFTLVSFFSFVILALLVSTSSGQQCETFECSNQMESCFTYQKESSQLYKVYFSEERCSKCFSKLYLSEIIDPIALRFLKPALEKNNEDCAQVTVNNVKKYNGETCNAEDQCYSLVCEQDSSKSSKVCLGKLLGSKCKDNLTCDNNLRCVNDECVQTLSADQVCSDSQECKNSLLCFNGKCTAIGSVKEGFVVSEPMLCETGLQNKDKTCKGSHQINEKPNGVLPQTCSIFPLGNQRWGDKEGLIEQRIQSILQQIVEKNVYCPSSVKFSEDCHLVRSQIKELREISFIESNNFLIGRLPRCLQNQLAITDIFRLFEQEQLDQPRFNSFVLVIAMSVIIISGVYFLIKHLQYKDVKATQVEEKDKRTQVSQTKKKDDYQLPSMQQAEPLSLEYNPTTQKVEALRKHMMNPLETTLDSNLFSIDGGQNEVDEEALSGSVRREIKGIEDQAEGNAKTESENKSESEVSFDDVFNNEANPSSQPRKSRRDNRSTRKKIIKTNNEKKYQVVEE